MPTPNLYEEKSSPGFDLAVMTLQAAKADSTLNYDPTDLHSYKPVVTQMSQVSTEQFDAELLNLRNTDIVSLTLYNSVMGLNGSKPTTEQLNVISSDPGDIVKGFHDTAMGNGQRMVSLFGTYLRYCSAWGRWMVWDGRRWSENDLMQVEAFSKRTVRSIYAEAAETEDDATRQDLGNWARKSESHHNRQAMIASARSEPGIPIIPLDLDTDKMLLNVMNGTLDLVTGELKDHDPDDLITKLAGTDYDPDAECPLWLGFLEYFLDGDQEMIAYLQRAVGLSLTGEVRKAFFIISGEGDNGKSTFVEAIAGMMGDYASKCSTATITVQRFKGIGNDVADLRGARFIYASELDHGAKLSEAFVKEWTGQTQIRARQLYQEGFTMLPEGKMWLDTNHKPDVSGTDNAIWNRLKVIDFSVTIPKDEQDDDFQAKLRDEYPGILAWAVRGCLAWQKEKLSQPQSVTDATKGYRGQQDSLQQFLDESCITGPQAQVKKSALFDEYQKWGGQLGKIKFGVALKAKGIKECRISGSGQKAWSGIGLFADD